MSESPSIEMRWGGGKWPKSPKRRLRPILDTVLGLAQDSLDYMQVTPSQPKLATIWGVHNFYPDNGSSLGPNNFELYVRQKFLKYPRKMKDLVIPLALTSVHELMHCVRDEEPRHLDLVERAAGEGISHWSEQITAKALLTKEEFTTFQRSFSTQIEPSVERILLGHFLEDVVTEFVIAEENPDDPEILELHEMWFCDNHVSMQVGNRLGVMAVGRLLNVGASIADIVRMPAHDIMGLQM